MRAPISVARPLEFKKRVRMREDTPVEVSARWLPPLALPVLSYWVFSGIVIYSIATGAVPLRRWLEAIDEPSPDTAILAVAPEAPEPERAVEPDAPPVAPAPEPVATPLPLATEAPVIAEVPTEPTAPPPDTPAPPPPQRTEPPRLAALDPPPFARPRVKRLSVSGFSAGSALTWQSERDPYLESLPALELPEPSPPERPRPSLPSRPRRELEPPEDEPRKPPRDEPPPPIAAVPAGSSCEAAVAAYNEEMDMKGGKRVADLPREAFAAVLDRGTYLAGCGVPDTMRVDICAAVQRGRAVGVTVVTRPANGRIQSCVARAVRTLRFPSHPKLDVARTRFE